MRTAKDAFLVKEWHAADADPRDTSDPTLSQGVSCDDAGCVVAMDDGAFVSLALHPDALADDCERAALVVTTRQAPGACASAVIDRDRLRRQGTMALRRTRDGFTVDVAKPRGLDQPWAPAVAGDTDAEAILLAPRRTVPRDATPAEADLQADD